MCPRWLEPGYHTLYRMWTAGPRWMGPLWKGTAMSEAELGAIVADKIVDARGTSCPGPILAAKKGMVEVSSGGVMEVQATDSGTLKDIPAWSRKMRHEYLGSIEEAGYLRLFIKKA